MAINPETEIYLASLFTILIYVIYSTCKEKALRQYKKYMKMHQQFDLEVLIALSDSPHYERLKKKYEEMEELKL